MGSSCRVPENSMLTTSACSSGRLTADGRMCERSHRRLHNYLTVERSSKHNMNNVLSIEQLFSERVLRVPDYQRGYAWEEPHLDELLEDIELLPQGKHHYTGTVVLHATEDTGLLDEEGKSYSVFNVVDGQQRLTTLVLLLDSIRRQ